MPRGKYVNHKGRARNFTSSEELEEAAKKAQRKNCFHMNVLDFFMLEKKLRVKKEGGDASDSEEEESSEEEDAGDDGSGESGSGSDSDDSDADKKAKGVQGLIEIENPNRVQKKTQKLKTLDNTAGQSGQSELSRREREEIEKQRAQAHYQKLHAEGKTDQARADLARLAIIKQHRAEAAARREQEKKDKEDKKKTGTR